MITDDSLLYWIFNITTMLMVIILPLLCAIILSQWQKLKAKKEFKEEDYYIYSDAPNN